MKRLLSIAAFAALGAAALIPLSVAAQTRVDLTITNQAPVRVVERHDVHDRYARERYYNPQHGYAHGGWSARDGRYVEQRRWIDRERRGRRDLDRDGIWDRYDRDLDNDGVANRYDRDMDGDGVRNRRDRRPENRYVY